MELTIDAYQVGPKKDQRDNKNHNKYSKNEKAGTGSAPERNENIHNHFKVNKNRTCHHCGKRGHIMRDCYLLKKSGQGKYNNYQKSNARRSVDAFYSESSVGNNNEINLEAQVADSNDNDLEEWLLDSEATSHFCNKKSWFEDLKNISPIEILVGDRNAKSQVLGKGNVVFHIKNRNNFVRVKLLNVLYAPNMRRNLISGASLDVAGFKIRWQDSKMEVYKPNNKYFFTIHRNGRLYVIHGISDTNYQEIYTSQEKLKDEMNMKLVHRRFCHLNTSLINNMSKKNIVNGIENVHGEVGTCNTCKLSKATRLLFKATNEIKTKEILDRVYMDV